MKLYTAGFSPNPRRVEIYLREKPFPELERVKLDMAKGEHRTPEALARNPLGALPVLELDDGRVLTESLAIIEYLEELSPTPPLVGADPWQRAVTREATRLAELGLLAGAELAFQHTAKYFATRHAQSEVIADWGRKRFATFARRLDGLLDGRTWLAGDLFTVADITAICAIDFGAVSGCAVDPELANLGRWLAAIRERPSCMVKRK